MQHSCTKHYAAHDGPDDIREYFTANVTTFDLFDTYLPSTEAQVVTACALHVLTGRRCWVAMWRS